MPYCYPRAFILFFLFFFNFYFILFYFYYYYFFFGDGTLFCYSKCSYYGEENPTFMIWEGMGDGHHQSPLG